MSFYFCNLLYNVYGYLLYAEELRSLQSYNVGNKVGSGTFCVVYKGTERSNDEIVALKKINYDVASEQGFPVTVIIFFLNYILSVMFPKKKKNFDMKYSSNVFENSKHLQRQNEFVFGH